MNKFTLTLFSLTYLTISVAQTTNPSPYCVANYDEPTSIATIIKNVAIGTLSNQTDVQSAFPRYAFYNNLAVPDLEKGTGYLASIIFNPNGDAGYGVWIDYNQNNIFEDSEKILGTNGNPITDASGSSIFQFITIPITATVGNTRMRVRIAQDASLAANSYLIPPCNATTSGIQVLDNGETEDYTVNIINSLGINENSFEKNVWIYPNPAKEVINIKINDFENISYKMYTVLGEEIKNGNLQNKET
jgi:hypothetical protein